MEATATVKEKEYSRDVYNILLYLIIMLLCLHGTYWFTLHFRNLFTPGSVFNIMLLRCADFFGNYSTPFQKNVILYIVLLLCVLLSMLSAPKANPKASQTRANGFLISGVALLLSGSFFLVGVVQQAVLIVILLSEMVGVLLIIRGGLEFASMAAIPELDIFNDENEQFPQNEALITNAFSVNYKLQFPFNRIWKEGYINVVNPQRAVLVLGSQGSGKTFTVLIPAIWQSIAKGYAALVYDVKYPDLSLEAYNALFKALKNDKFCFGRTPEGKLVIPKFGAINFDNVSLSIRSNPLSEKYIQSIEEAGETAKVLMLNLNRTWIKKEGDFFAESAINYLTVTIWYLRLMEQKYTARLGNRPLCTLPHCIELISQNPKEVIGCMINYEALDAYTSMFQVAMANKAGEQLAGQVASAQNALARLSSPKIYWVMSADEMDLDINNPEAPKILCLANNPEKINIYSSALSVYTATIMRLIYRFRVKLKVSTKSATGLT